MRPLRSRSPLLQSQRRIPSRGFTLIELLIVVAIIAILAAIAVPNFLEAQVRAKVSRVKTDIRTTATGLEAYIVDNNKYPYEIEGGSFPHLLTTPVAYLTQNLIDPFRIQASSDVQLPYDKRTYRYFRFMTQEEESRPNVAAWRANDGDYECDSQTLDYFGAWGVASYGPDLFFDCIWGGFTFNDPTNRLYDSTNGTTSRGDIARTQKQRGMNSN